MRKEKGTRAAVFAVILLVLTLAFLDFMIHVFALRQGAESIPDPKEEIIVIPESSESKSANEVQYEELLLREQAVLEEIERLQENTDYESVREDKMQLDYLEEELHRVQVLKKVLEERKKTARQQ